MLQIMHFLRRIPISYASKSLATMGKKRKKVLRRVCGELRIVQQTLRNRKSLLLNDLRSCCGEVESCGKNSINHVSKSPKCVKSCLFSIKLKFFLPIIV